MQNVIAIIISYNDPKALLATTLAIKDQVKEIVIVDNGSEAEYNEALTSIEINNNIHFIRLGKNLGIAKALNIGVKYALDKHASWVLTLDQDSLASQHMVDNLLEIAKVRIDAGVITATTDQVEFAPRVKELDVAITSGNLVNIKVFDNVNYNDSYFIDSVDFDFCLKVRDAGWKILQSGDAFLSHRLGTQINISFMGLNFNYVQHSPLRRYYIFRNHILLFKDHFRKHSFFLFKKSMFLFKIFIAIILFDKKRFKNLKMIFKGINDGFSNKRGPFLN